MNKRDGDSVAEVVVERVRTVLKPPPPYKVVLVNDDFTPMDFVVLVLQQFFNMDSESATRVMLQVHTTGKGVCGVFTYDVAETKVAQVMHCARTHGNPLLCQMEAA